MNVSNDPTWVIHTGHEFEDRQKFNKLFDHWSFGDEWNPPQAKLIFKDQGRELFEGDYLIGGGGGPIISQRAAKAVEPLVQNGGAILPIPVSNGPDYCLIYSPARPQVLDWDKSEYENLPPLSPEREKEDYFPSDYYGSILLPRVWEIKSYVFRPEEIAKFDVTKICTLHEALIVSERFVQTWNDAGLNGAVFYPIWDGAQSLN